MGSTAAEIVADSVAAERTASGIWSLEDGRLVNVEAFESGPAVVLVRSEHVLVLATPLPPMSGAARRRAALPFAIEDRIADPLEDVHIALGSEVSPGIWLAAVVRHQLMRQWVASLVLAGLEDALLVPDALSLPVPGEGSWSVDLAGTRAMIRAADGTGFATPLALLGAAWKAAGNPECVAYGDPLPPDMHGANAGLEVQPLAARLLAPAIDLRQGPYARPRRRIDPLWKRMAVVAAIGAAAHGAIAMADTIALSRQADAREAEARALASTMRPDLAVGPDIGVVLADMTPDVAADAPSPFLALVTRTGTALATLPQPVGWRSIEFDAATGALVVEIEADTIGGLQGITQALDAGGLAVQPGSASTDQGRAIGAFTVRSK